MGRIERQPSGTTGKRGGCGDAIPPLTTDFDQDWKGGLATTGQGDRSSLPLRSWMVAPRRIGGRTYQGECIIARVRHVTYQQQSTTSGRTAGILGLSSDGAGFVTGGGGFIDTTHQGVVNVVLEDEVGRHMTLELPSEISVLPDSIVRLDQVNGRMIAATNITGRQGRIITLGPSGFIEAASFTKLHAALTIAAMMMAGQILSPHFLAGLAMTAALAALPVHRFQRIQSLRRQRAELKNYMLEVLS
ncbi:hypothetical protein [Sphingomonas melonis]|uniref:Uncharacterized protein n=1 Tax=Sphingomonas melonis TaxID=152682 RepID=A0A7Y9FKK0_9SPHN|nr:hypothetical protein [Sphingomonas melonis]NYD89036.1 hypothetical protein [Sphingomonas melonis]